VSPGSGPPDSRSIFPIGSISKQFTAAAIVALAELVNEGPLLRSDPRIVQRADVRPTLLSLLVLDSAIEGRRRHRGSTCPIRAGCETPAWPCRALRPRRRPHL
jgi:hypothetical protein